MTIDFTTILDPDFPTVDRARVTPTVDKVALLEQTRTVDQSGAILGEFTSSTRPTAAQVAELILQAVESVLAEIPDYIPESVYPRVLQAVTFSAAVLVEISFFREQYHQGSAQAYEGMYEKLLASIERLAGMGGAQGGRRIDSIMARSTMAEYEPDYPPPPPRVMPKLPFSIDGDPGSEGQADN